MRKYLMFVGLVVCMLSATSLGASQLIGITFGEQLISINKANGAGTLIGNLDSSMAGYGLSVRGSKLYTYDQFAYRIQELDPTTAHTLNTINIGLNVIGEGCLAFRSDGLGFLVDNNGPTGQLYSFDITVPSSTLITATAPLTPSMDGLDFDGSDILYGLSQGNYDLYTINQTTGVTTLVGATGITSGTSLGGLVFDSGTLYAIMNDSLYTLNPTTAAPTFIGQTGFNNVSGLAAVDATTIPVPGALLLGGLGAGVVGWFRRRRML